MKRTLCNFNQYGLLALILLAFSAGPLMAQSPTVVKTDVGTTSEKQVTEKSVFQTENSVAKVIDEQRSNVIVNDDADVVLNSEKVRVSSRTIPSSSNLDGLTPANVNPDESSFPAPMKKSQQVTNPDKWEFGFAPYLFTAGLKGTIGARGRTADIDLSFGDIFKKLKLGIMGTLDARKGKFVIVNDMMWIKLAKETETP